MGHELFGRSVRPLLRSSGHPLTEPGAKDPRVTHAGLRPTLPSGVRGPGPRRRLFGLGARGVRDDVTSHRCDDGQAVMREERAASAMIGCRPQRPQPLSAVTFTAAQALFTVLYSVLPCP